MICKVCNNEEEDCICSEFSEEKLKKIYSDIYEEEKRNPPPYTEGHNPFGKNGVYVPGDPGL